MIANFNGNDDQFESSQPHLMQSFIAFAFLTLTMKAEGGSTRDKALACHAGSWGSNPDTTKVYSAPILSGTHAMCTLSHNACCHALHCQYLSHGRQKEKNRGTILAAPSVGQNTDISVMFGKKGVKNFDNETFLFADTIWKCRARVGADVGRPISSVGRTSASVGLTSASVGRTSASVGRYLQREHNHETYFCLLSFG